MNACAIIPARYESTRFPAKPLQELLGKPMIIHVCERANSAFKKKDIYVATDDRRILDAVTKAGFQAVMTSRNCLTGTDRVAEAALQLSYSVIFNIQGDEPALSQETIEAVIKGKVDHPGLLINAMAPLNDTDDPYSFNLPKVVTTETNQLVYMSRAPIPAKKSAGIDRCRIRKQVCVYAFDREHLHKFVAFGRKSRLEQSEDIEILRFLEIGVRIQMIEVGSGSVAVDSPDDVPKAEEAIRQLK